MSLNKFLMSDYMEYIENLNINSGDIICFYLGEIDIRIAIHRYCLEKNKNLEDSFLLLMERYLKCLISIKEKYKNRIIILSPNPPMENYHQQDLIAGTKEERIMCQNIFHNFWNHPSEVAEYLDWTSIYKKENGFVREDLLINNDHHLSDYNYMVTNLKKKINE